MNELLETYKLEIASLKSEKEKLIKDNKKIFTKNKSLYRSNLRLKKLVRQLRETNLEEVRENIDSISDNWDEVQFIYLQTMFTNSVYKLYVDISLLILNDINDAEAPYSEILAPDLYHFSFVYLDFTIPIINKAIIVDI